jgi:hypothetical protein
LYNLDTPKINLGIPPQSGNTPKLQSSKFKQTSSVTYHKLGTFNLCAKKPEEKFEKKGLSIVEYGT